VTGSMFVTYLWHYIVVRLIYDELVRPLAHGSPAGLMIALGCAAVVASLVRRRRRLRG
jgi:hypothetical protein